MGLEEGGLCERSGAESAGKFPFSVNIPVVSFQITNRPKRLLAKAAE